MPALLSPKPTLPILPTPRTTLASPRPTPPGPKPNDTGRGRSPARPKRLVAAGLSLAVLVSLLLARPTGAAAAAAPAPTTTQAASATAASATAAPAATSPIPVYLDGLTVNFDVPPVIVDGRALVPFRLLAEALGCTVDWNEQDRHVRAVGPAQGAGPTAGTDPASGGGPAPAGDEGARRTVDLWVDKTEALVNGQARTMDVPPRIIDGRTLIPLRFFGEALGAVVDWNGTTRTITVTSPPRTMEVLGYYALGNAQTSSWTELFGRAFPGSGVGATDFVSEVACAWYVLDAGTGRLVLDDSYSGQKRPDNWQDVLDKCRAYAVQADMMVHWARTDQATGVCDSSIYRFLSSTAAMRQATSDILAHAADYRGVNLDIEYLGQRQSGDELALTQQRFTAFIRMVADALHARGQTLTLSLHPLNSWYRGYDWKALGELADRIVIMAYGYASQGPQPIEKVAEAVDQALEVVPAEKLLLGLLAGRTAQGQATYETAETIAVKVGLAKRRGIAGIALWRLGVWGRERLVPIRRAVSRPPAVSILYDRATGALHLTPVDTTSAPPLLAGGRHWVPLLPILQAVGISATWDPGTGQAVVDLGIGLIRSRAFQAVPADQVDFAAAEAPEAITVRGQPYVPAGVMAELVRQFVPSDASYSFDTAWDPASARLVLATVPRMS